MASTQKGSKVYGFGDAWTKAERRAQQLHADEGMYEGYQERPLRKIGPAGKQMEVHEDAALGLDGCDFHMGGDRVTKIKEEALPGGDVAVYFQNVDSGGTYVVRGHKVGEGRHRLDKPRRIYTF